MNHLEEALTVIERAKNDLLVVITSALKDNKYEEAERILSWLKNFTDISCNNTSTLKENNAAISKDLQSHRTRKIQSGNTKTPRTKYPIFIKRNDNLVKIGWSRKENSPYEHKADMQIIQAVVRKILAVGKNGKIFNSLSFLPVCQDNGSPVPDYQAYLVLKWLIASELIQQHGRRGYSINESDRLEKNINNIWEGLHND
jgi:hypothetical protein